MLSYTNFSQSPINVVEEIQELLGVGLGSYTNSIINALQNNQTIAPLLSQALAVQAIVGWTTTGHTGEDVNLYAFGPGSNNFFGNVNNIDIANKIIQIFGFDIATMNQKVANFNPVPPSNNKRYYNPYHDD